MNGQEITVAVAERLPVIFIILSDRSYGMVKQRHRQLVKDGLEFAIPPVDFSLMAKAMGANGYSIRQPEDFEKVDYQAICSYPGPTVLDVQIDPEELSPLGMF
jgi:acetolactate synthase-1/2/3 large subunit